MSGHQLQPLCYPRQLPCFRHLRPMLMLLAIVVAVISGACAVDAPSPRQPAASLPARDTSSQPASFVNKVWTVAESQQVALGELHVFLSTGTLVMASPHGTPAFGTWSETDGRLTITEEGLPYKVDILELTDQTFRIRINSPGEPVVIRFAPAEPSSQVTSGANGPTSPSSSPPPRPGPEPRLLGVWTVVGHHMPGVSAMTDTEAGRLYGRAIRLTKDQATTEEQRCDRPVYSSQTVETGKFLAVEYKLPPRSLSPLTGLDRITVLDTTCDSTAWTAMGGRLIEVSADRALTPWNGVFFELARDSR